jgi:hypothetical protein
MSSNRILSVLLRLYPRRERATFGPLIIQAFNDRRRELSTRGAVRRLGATAWMLWDVARNGLSRRLAFPVDKTMSVSLGALVGASLAGAWTVSFFRYTPPASVAVAISLGGAAVGATLGATRVSRRWVHAVLGALAAMSLGSLGFTLLNVYGPWFSSDILPLYFWFEVALAVLGASLGLVGLVRKRPGVLLGAMLGVWVIGLFNSLGFGFNDEQSVVSGLALAVTGVAVGAVAGAAPWTQKHLVVPIGMLVGSRIAGLMLRGLPREELTQVTITGTLLAGLFIGGLLALIYERHVGRSTRLLQSAP